MDRIPVKQAVLPSYPHRRGHSWALGLLALGGTALVSAGLAGCGDRLPPAAHAEGATCAGDMPAAQLEGDPVAIPEIEPVRVRGDMAAPDPHVEPVIESQPIEGDVPAVDGDMVEPTPEPVPVPVPEVRPVPEVETQVVVAPPDESRVAGGMPVPEMPVDEVEQPVTPPEPIPGGMRAPREPEPAEPTAVPEDGDKD